MIKKSAYLSSLIFSVILVFSVVASCFAVMLCINVNSKNAVKLFDDNSLDNVILKEINGYYDEQYYASGIPSSVYMTAIDSEYIKESGHICIEKAFETLKTGHEYTVNLPENSKLDTSIETFLSDYAEQSDIKKDEKYDKKLSSVKSSAYETMVSKSDIFKFRTINSKGILSKLSVFYRNRYLLTGAVCGLTFFIAVILFVINRKNKSLFLYWTGISSLIAGVSGIAVSAYLLASKYFDAFSIKQHSVFTAYTETMYKLAQAFLTIEIAVTVIGIIFIVIFSIINEKKNTDDKKSK